MDNQHRKIGGYRELKEDEIAVMNAIKAWEASWNRIVDSLKAAGGEYDQRCVAIAATHIETGMMFAVKAVAQPVRLVEGVNYPPGVENVPVNVA